MASVLTTGCATQQVPLNAVDQARIKRVATVSMAASTFTRQYVGVTVFGNEREQADVANWKIDKDLEDQINQRLARDRGMTPVEAPYAADEFAHVNDLNGPWDALAFKGPNWEKIAPAVKNYCTANTLDGVVVVARATTSDFLSGTNQLIEGLGLYARNPGGRAYLHLMARIALYDCATAKPLAVRTLSGNQAARPGEMARAMPLAPFDFEKARLPLAELQAQEGDKLRSQVMALYGRAITATLDSIFGTVP